MQVQYDKSLKDEKKKADITDDVDNISNLLKNYAFGYYDILIAEIFLKR